MANISEYISKIKTAIYGKDVRGSLADGLDAVNKETEAATTLTQETAQRQTSIEKQFDDQIANMTLADPSSAELVAARTNVNTGESYDTIGRRLDAEHADVTAQLAEESQKRGDMSAFRYDDPDLITKMKNEFTERGVNLGWFVNRQDYDNGVDISDQFQAVLDNFSTQGKKVLIHVTKPITITKKIMVDIRYICIDWHHQPINCEFDGTAFQCYMSHQETILNTNTYFKDMILNKTNNLGDAILFHTDGEEHGAGFTLINPEIEGFARGLVFQSNAYLITITNPIITCLESMVMPSGYDNYGENIRVFGGVIGGDLCFRNENVNGDFQFINTSFDYFKKLAVLKGGATLISPHIESGNENTPFADCLAELLNDQMAKLVIKGGKMLFQTSPAEKGADYLFKTANPNWGGGVFLEGVQMFNTYTKSGFLCGGTGLINISNPIIADGSGSNAGIGTIMAAANQNKLIDGNFNNSVPLDVFIVEGDNATQTESDTLKITSGNGILTLNHKISGGTASALIMCRAIPGKIYSGKITIGTGNLDGNVYLTPVWLNIPYSYSGGFPHILKKEQMYSATLTYPRTIEEEIYFQVQNPVCPPWATHFGLYIALTTTTVGSINFKKAFITELG